MAGAINLYAARCDAQVDLPRNCIRLGKELRLLSLGKANGDWAFKLCQSPYITTGYGSDELASNRLRFK